MAKRTRADARLTVLCATKYLSNSWIGARRSDPLYEYAATSVLRREVHEFVKQQGYTGRQIEQAERGLIKEGKLSRILAGRSSSLRLQPEGQKTSCARVRLSPVTDWRTDHPFEGRRRR